MPLIKSRSKKAFEHNVKAEIDAHPDKRKQDLAIAFAVQRKAGKKPKKMAEGGAVSAKTEKRPMPDEAHNDAMQEAHNRGMKAAHEDKWTDQPTVAQARKPSMTRLSAPKIIGSDAFSVRNREDVDKEKDLQNSAKPMSPKSDPKLMTPVETDEHGDDPDMPKPHTTRKAYAKGGMINEDVPFSEAEEDEVEHPAGLESDNDQIKPSDEEIMSQRFASGGSVDEEDSDMVSRPDKGWGAIIVKPGQNNQDPDMMAKGGMIDGGAEEEDMMHDSIAAAIMAKRDRMKPGSDSDDDRMQKMASGGTVESGSSTMNYADGGEVDIDENAEEQPNDYYNRNENAVLKENYDSDMDDVSQPQDSNEHGDLREEDEENLNDMVDKIRRKIAMKRQFGSK